MPESILTADNTDLKSGFYQCDPWHFLYFFPEPHGHGSFLPGGGVSYLTVGFFSSSPVTNRQCPSSRSNKAFSRWWRSSAPCLNCASNDTNALFSLTCFVSMTSKPRQVDVSDHSRIKARSICLRVRECVEATMKSIAWVANAE